MQSNTSRFNPDAEKALLGAFYLTPELLYQVELEARDFHIEDHRKIYGALLQLFMDGIKPDLVTVANTDNSISKTLIFDIFSNAVTSANAEYHAKIIRELSDRRRYYNAVLSLQGKVDEDNFLQEVERTFLELQERPRRGRTVTVKEALVEIADRMLKNSAQESVGIQTGFSKLNDAIVGLCPQHLVLLGAYTSHGKSTFLSQIVADICRNDARTLIFSVEDAISDKLQRLMATISGVPISRIVKGRFNDEEGTKVAMAIQEIKEFPLVVYDDIYNLDEMELKIKKHKMQGGIDVVAVDFVQNILAGGENIYDRMSQVAIRLQRMAKKYEVCMFALSQISEGKEKGSISLRGAQELASAADVVLWIERQEDSRDFSLIIRKNRQFGRTGKIPMRFTETWTGMEESYDGRGSY